MLFSVIIFIIKHQWGGDRCACGCTTGWVQVVVDPRASEAKRDEAFALLVFTHVLLGSTGAVLLWPFLLGTLLRRVRFSLFLSCPCRSCCGLRD